MGNTLTTVDGSTSPSLLLASDLIPEYKDKKGDKKKWEVVEDVQPSNFNVSDIEMVAFLEEGETYVSGEVTCSRAIALKANMGLVDAKRMLDNARDIPVACRGKCLLFTGTKLRHPSGDLFVPYLCFNGIRWCLKFRRVSNDWYGIRRLLRCK